MRRLAIAALLLAALRVDAKPIRASYQGNPEPPRTDFWRDMLEPHADEVRHILQIASQSLQQGDIALWGDYDPTGQGRARYYHEAYGMLRYAHRLAPENIDVLRLLGQTADELGKTRQALDAFETAVHLVGPDKAGPEVTGRLGAIYLRLGRVDEAIRFLRYAQGPIISGKPVTAMTLVHLSNALARRGDMGDAIDVLSGSLQNNIPYPGNEVTLVGFALAVQLDRDEQRGAAFDAIDHMQTQLTTSFAATVQNGIAMMRFAPAEDQHYYQALLYEVMGNYTEARAEWLLYAAGDPPFRARALDHVAAIDTLRRAPAPHAPHGRPVGSRVP
ncbi:MAG: tetratricopeptide repeat protein [Acidobacteriota bacterium]